MYELKLNPEDLTLVRAIIVKYVPDKVVLAFGSRVSGHAHDGSDLDLVVINPKHPSKPEECIVQLKEAFIESNLPILVDIIDWAVVSEKFHQEIRRAYKIIQGDKPAVLS